MRLCYSTLFLTYCVAVLEARRADVDINRIRLVKVEESANNIATGNFHSRRSANLIRNDNDDRGRGFLHQQTHQRLSEHETPAEPRQTIKVYEPKEDPRLFYQSDAYLKEIVSGQANNEVAEVYPRNDVVSGGTGAGGETRTASMPYRVNERSQRILASTRNLCIKCPAERTLIAKPGSDRVIFQKPKLTTCSERRAPKNVHFVRMYGPAFGTLLGKGSHTLVGKVMYKGLTLQLCRMEVQVVTQTCSTPEYLRVHCDSKNVCNFTCQNEQFELYGKSSLVCGDNLQWIGTLPTCIERSWCEYPAPPAHGRLSCIGAGGSGRLAEGARCKARCRRGWRWTPRVTAICSRGQWTSNLICQPRRINWSQ